MGEARAVTGNGRDSRLRLRNRSARAAAASAAPRAVSRRGAHGQTANARLTREGVASWPTLGGHSLAPQAWAPGTRPTDSVVGMWESVGVGVQQLGMWRYCRSQSECRYPGLITRAHVPRERAV